MRIRKVPGNIQIKVRISDYNILINPIHGNNWLWCAWYICIIMLISICAIFHVMNLKVIKWFDYLWMSQKNSDEDKSINCLPGIPLKKWFKKYVYGNYFCRESISFQCFFFFQTPIWNRVSHVFQTHIRVNVCPPVQRFCDSHILHPDPTYPNFSFSVFYIFKPKVCSHIRPVRRCLCIIFAYQLWRWL